MSCRVRQGRRPSLVRPRAIAAGATIGVCAPSGPVRPEVLDAGIAWLEREGFRVRVATHLRERCGYLAGTDDERCGDLAEMVDDSSVDAIVLARGGYGCSRILRRLDPQRFRAARKPIVGYSDATLLLLWLLRQAGLVSIHGPMLERVDADPCARGRLLDLLRGEHTAREPLRGEGIRGACARGRLVGGNLSMVVASLGTPWEIDTRNAILFLEEVDEAPYAIDRMLVHLRDAGKLAPLVGVAVGRLVDCTSERYPEPRARDTVRDILLEETTCPIAMEFPFGHVADNRALGLGVRAELDARLGTLALVEPVVEGAV